MQTKFIKKMISGLVAAVTCITATTFTSKNIFFANAKNGRAVADGVYYIRNLNSGKYLDISWSGTANGTEVIQFGYNGGLNQQFRVNLEDDGYYTIKPMHCPSSAIDLRSESGADTNGTDAQLYTYCKANEQKFTIDDAAGGGFKIGTKCSNGKKVLEVTNSSLDSRAIVQIWENSDTRTNDNWVFEKVNKRSMSYFLLTENIETPNKKKINKIVSSFNKFGFDAKRYNCPDLDTITLNSASDILVLHGHGSTGYILADKRDSDGKLSQDKICSEKYSSSDDEHDVYSLSEIIPKTNWSKISFVYLATCFSANDSNPKIDSLAKSCYNLGAKCVIGFQNTVAGAEDFLMYMMQAAEKNPDLTVQQAITQARIKFMNEKSSDDPDKPYNPYTADDSPANLNNLKVYGDSSICFKDLF